MKSDNFENIIKNTIQNVEIEPPQDVWTNITKKLFLKSIFKIFIFTFLGLSIFSIILFYNFNKKVVIKSFNAENTKFKILSFRLPVEVFDNNITSPTYTSTVVNIKNTCRINTNPFSINPITNNYIQGNYTSSKKWTINNTISNSNIDEKIFKVSENNVTSYTFLPLPMAYFEYTMPIYSKSKVKFINKCENSSKYKWYVNYELKSTDSIFEYSFPKADIYVVTLVASNIQGVDDTISQSVVALEPDKYIAFPNAFCPNTSGASGGYYNENSQDNSIFRPFVYSKSVVQYKLTIMNRTGQVIYSSQELLKGWDGYFNNKIVPVGVYLFVAEGKFDDGQSFKEFGSITVLY